MAVRKLYLGDQGPFYYDDEVPVNDPDGDFDGELQHAILSEGGLKVGGVEYETKFIDLVSAVTSDDESKTLLNDVTVNTQTITVVTDVDFASETVTTENITFVTGINLSDVTISFLTDINVTTETVRTFET